MDVGGGFASDNVVTISCKKRTAIICLAQGVHIRKKCYSSTRVNSSSRLPTTISADFGHRQHKRRSAPQAFDMKEEESEQAVNDKAAPIPTISLKALDSGAAVKPGLLDHLASSILSACVSHGFFYLTDAVELTGDNAHIVDEAWKAAEALFLDDDAGARQERLQSRDRERHTGYTALGEEKLDPQNAHVKQGDAKESFYIARLAHNPIQTLPPALAPFHDGLSRLFETCIRVCKFILGILGRALEIGDDFFTSQHASGLDRLRLIHYPPAALHNNGIETAIRAGSHSDYGSITLLFQRAVSGLQVLIDNKWADVPPKEGAIVVNVGDALEFWTAGLFRSAQHRVVMPRTEAETVSRFSIAYFCQPDEEARLDPILLTDALQKTRASESFPHAHHRQAQTDYEDVLRRKGIGNVVRCLTGGEHLKARLAATYS